MNRSKERGESAVPQSQSVEKPPPAVPDTSDLAYALALSSYDEAQKRSDVLEKRLQELMTVATTLTAAVLAFFSQRQVPFRHWAFYIGIFAAASGIAVGFAGRLTEKILLLDLQKLWAKGYLSQDPESFKWDMVAWAASNRATNEERLCTKSLLTNIAALLFVAEVTFLGLWVVLAPTSAKSPGSGHIDPSAQKAADSSQVHPVKQSVVNSQSNRPPVAKRVQ